jgi:hypothetical protein
VEGKRLQDLLKNGYLSRTGLRDDMKVVGVYSIKDGEKVLKNRYSSEFNEIIEIIESIDAEVCKNKVSKERTKAGALLYSPTCLNKAFKQEFEARGWRTVRVQVEYPKEYYVEGYEPSLAVVKTRTVKWIL